MKPLPESPQPGDLLVRAIDVIELASHHIFSEAAAVSFKSPTDLMYLSDDEQDRVRHAEDLSYQSQPALSAVNFCLRSAISLVAVAHSLVEQEEKPSPEEQERSWKRLGVHTKLAGRAAYRAALILCDPEAGTVRGARPATALRLVPAAAQGTPETLMHESRKDRVLIVEDESVAAFLLQHTLVALGYEVVGVAVSSSQALDLARQEHPDVVLMDINLGAGGDGIDTAALLTRSRRTPVIYLTSHSEDAVLGRARGTGAYGYLIKPFSGRELHATIQMAIERHRSDTVLADSEERLRLALASFDGRPIAESGIGPLAAAASNAD